MNMVDLIKTYLAEAEACITMFEVKFGRRDLLKAWREGAIPQTGEVAQGVEYQMHGVGCMVDFRDHLVDFDFAYSNEVGFDAWRLWQYAKQFPQRYPEYQEKAAVESMLADLVVTGMAEPFGGHSNLLRLTEKAMAR